MVTLKDVAKKAGVSVSLVSYVLNGKKKGRPETYKKIMDAVEELDYYPNLAASGLKTNCSRIIGVVVPDMMDLFFTELLNNLEKDLLEQGYCLIVCNSENSAKIEKRCIRNLLSRRIDGLILMGTEDNDYTFLHQQEVPIVCVDRISGKDIPTNKTDNIKGGLVGAEYLHKKGYRDICFFGVKQKGYAIDRMNGFIEYAKDNQLDYHTFELENLSYEQVNIGVKQILSKGEVYPKAIFCCTDAIAAYTLRALAEHGVKVPEDMAVLGFGNSTLCEYTNPPITTVAQDKKKISRDTVDYIMRMLDGEKKMQNIDYDSFIVERGTV